MRCAQSWAASIECWNCYRWTIQTMVFEPAALKMHLSIGAGPTSGRPLTTLDLGPLVRTK